MELEEQILEMVKKESFEQGQKQLKTKLVSKLIFSLGYTDKQAAEFIEMPVDFVKKLRKQKFSLT